MLDGILNLVFPGKCPVCREAMENDGRLIHDECRRKLRYIEEPRCMRCGRHVETAEAELCFECEKKKHHYSYGFPVFEYNDAARRAMTDYKQNGIKRNGEFFAGEAVKRIGDSLLERAPQVLIPVPLHPSRLRERGFNQALIPADILGKALNIPVDDQWLKKTEKTAQQKLLGGRGRGINNTNVFRVDEPGKYRRVCLVDDIYTTGNTLEACTLALKRAGVTEAGFVVLCAGGGF